jgi:hypothetical protein
MREAIFWFAVALCVIAEIAILRSMGRASRHPAGDASPAGDAVPRSRPLPEMIWAVLPAVGLAVALAFTWRAIQ